jgi:hypothetical protein
MWELASVLHFLNVSFFFFGFGVLLISWRLWFV